MNMIDYLQPADLVTALSGLTRGVRWTVESEIVRRPGYRLFIDGKYLATLPTPMDAFELRDLYISDAVADLHAALTDARTNPTISTALLEEVERRLNQTTACDEAVALIEAL